MRRIGLITTSYPRWPGDPAGSFAAGHAAWLARAGWAVDVVCAGDPAAGGVEIRADAAGGGTACAGDPAGVATGHDPDRVEVVRVPSPPGLFYAGGAPDALESGAARLADAARFSARLTARARARARRWDAVIAHWLVPSGAIAAAVTAPAARPFGRRIPALAIAHSGDVHLVRRLGATPAVAALLAARGVRLVFVSRTVREAFAGGVAWAPLRRRIDRASIVCPMGIDAARFRALRRPRPAPLPGAAPAVLFLGRLVPIKGAHVLLAAAARVRRPIRLLVAGDGPERERLATLARGHPHPVELLGEVRGEARDRALIRADLAVLPSIALPGGRAEGMPVTALELMAAGVPVIASRTGGLSELPSEVAVRVPPDDPAALARALEAALADPVGLEARIAAGAAYAEQHDWARIGPRIDDHLLGR